MDNSYKTWKNNQPPNELEQAKHAIADMSDEAYTEFGEWVYDNFKGLQIDLRNYGYNMMDDPEKLDRWLNRVFDNKPGWEDIIKQLKKQTTFNKSIRESVNGGKEKKSDKMNDFDFKKYLAEGKLLKENEPNFEDIEIGDKFVERDDEDEVFTVVDVFVPEFTIDVESITLKDSDGIQTTYPDDFDDGEFFDWFKPLK
tara:strand:- start:25 stop:618 length:594 start_codon:yes stop_codon:yes gene_type:complete